MQNQFIIISPKRTVKARLAAHFQRHSDLAHSDLNDFPRTTKSIRETGRLSRSNEEIDLKMVSFHLCMSGKGSIPSHVIYDIYIYMYVYYDILYSYIYIYI